MISGWVGQYTCISFSLCIGLFHWSKIFSVGTSPVLSVLSFDPFTSGLLAARGWGLKPGSVAEERKIKLIMGIAALLPPLPTPDGHQRAPITAINTGTTKILYIRTRRLIWFQVFIILWF